MILKFEGGKELAAALAQLPARVSRRFLLESLEESAEPMRDRMESLAPRSPDAPHLRDQIVISRARAEDAREAAVVVGPTRRGFYGSFQEFGTAHHAPQPFARPAFDQTFAISLQILSQALWRELASKGISRTATAEAVVEGER